MKTQLATITLIIVAVAIGLLLKGSNEKKLEIFDKQLEVSMAEDFSLETLDNVAIRLSDYRDKKPIILDFFATWCPNCQRSMPQLNKFYQKYQSEVEILGINLHEDERIVSKYIQNTNIDYPILLDPDRKVQDIYGVVYTNYHVFINRKGEIIAKGAGDVTEEQIQYLIENSK